jgi:hypothetical protein
MLHSSMTTQYAPLLFAMAGFCDFDFEEYNPEGNQRCTTYTRTFRVLFRTRRPLMRTDRSANSRECHSRWTGLDHFVACPHARHLDELSFRYVIVLPLQASSSSSQLGGRHAHGPLAERRGREPKKKETRALCLLFLPIRLLAKLDLSTAVVLHLLVRVICTGAIFIDQERLSQQQDFPLRHPNGARQLGDINKRAHSLLAIVVDCSLSLHYWGCFLNPFPLSVVT